ncbi:MAG: cytochrome C oxidase subunit III [Acidimicrobiia bacterium]|nr:cytochrome C oxidase subunit III [Acidimicrobiia bacterium]
MTTSQTIKGTPPPPVQEGGWGPDPGKQRRASLTGMYVLFAAITMLFAAFTSALVVRRGLGDDWSGIPVPGILWVSSALIALSSVALEIARRRLLEGERERFTVWWTAGTMLGLLFLGGQTAAWRQLLAQGVYVSTSPGGSFFYLFTVAHAVHVVGGVVALLYIEYQALRLRLGPGKRTAVEVSRLYWHFLAGLWIYLILLFQFWG